MQYRVTDARGKEVKEGDKLRNSRGEWCHFKYVSRGPRLGKSAKVWTDAGEFYARVFDLTVEEAEEEAEEEPTEPEAEDWTTTDHKTFRVAGSGRVVLTVREDRNMWAELRRAMSDGNFWPNVWFISDHGNAHLMRPEGR